MTKDKIKRLARREADTLFGQIKVFKFLWGLFSTAIIAGTITLVSDHYAIAANAKAIQTVSQQIAATVIKQEERQKSLEDLLREQAEINGSNRAQLKTIIRQLNHIILNGQKK